MTSDNVKAWQIVIQGWTSPTLEKFRPFNTVLPLLIYKHTNQARLKGFRLSLVCFSILCVKETLCMAQKKKDSKWHFADDLPMLQGPPEIHRPKNCYPHGTLWYYPRDAESCRLQLTNLFSLGPTTHLSLCLPVNTWVGAFGWIMNVRVLCWRTARALSSKHWGGRVWRKFIFLIAGLIYCLLWSVEVSV